MPTSNAQVAIERLTRGRALVVYAEDVAAGRLALSMALEDVAPGVTRVEVDWLCAPPLTDELTEMRDALADAALALWPDWYISADARTGDRDEHRAEAAVLEQAEGIAGVSKTWLRRVAKRCAAGQLPVARSVTAAEQVRQLAIALDPSQLVVVLTVTDPEVTDGRLRGLARASEWLSQQTQARIMLVVPETWSTRGELDPVAYGAVFWSVSLAPEVSTAAPSSESPLGAGESEKVGRVRGERTGRVEGEPAKPKVHVGPILGRPHPRSRVEQIVAHGLREDAELADLFEFNQPLFGLGEQRYLVDLLWREGKLVVELDGDEHRASDVFVRDRERDYRLCMRGYTTLRVPNAEVLTNVGSVLAKIRNMVGLRRGWLAEQDGKTS